MAGCNKKGVEIKMKDSIDRAKEVIRIEAKAVLALEDRVDENFYRAVDTILKSKGRVIVSGIGKSGIVAKKIASTLSSTGTPSLFLHLAEGLHGDIGTVKKEDVVICVSKSGSSDEFHLVLPVFRRIGIPIIALTGDKSSLLAKFSDIIIDVSVDEEACPNDLAPTTSSTAALVMGDALAVALMHKREFSEDDFAFLHPGGTLGKRLTLKVEDIMFKGDFIPVVYENASFKEVVLEMNSKRFGCTCVLDGQDCLEGIITDGDLKRVLEKNIDFSDLKAKDIMTKNPKAAHKDTLAAKALLTMKKYNIMQLVVIDNNKIPVGMIHLHDVLKTGIS